MIFRSHKVAPRPDLPKAANGPPGPTADSAAAVAGPLDSLAAHRQLENLYEIGKLFATFENVEQTFDPALALVAGSLPLRSAILIETHDGHSRMIVWPSRGRDVEAMRAVKDRAESAYRYFVGTAAPEPLDFTEETGATELPQQAEDDGALVESFIVIPLVVAHRPPFGALQLEGARPLGKADLMFADAIASQLAIAIDRDRAWRRDITRRVHEGRTHAEAKEAIAEHERSVAQSLREKYEALAGENGRLYQQAQQAVRVRERILAIVSHDLKNPLGAILITTDALVKKQASEPPPPGLGRSVAIIQRSAERMLRLIEDLVDFASIEGGRLAIKRQPNDPSSIIHEALESFESVAQEKRQRLTTGVDPHLPMVYCDRDRILQVLSNLIGNAIKASPEGGHITVRVEPRERDLLFVVADNGPGIGDEDLKHLFEPYFRSGDVSYKGTGLGLAIAKGIVGAHGGRIWPESELGHGATFYFTVPTANAAVIRAGERRSTHAT